MALGCDPENFRKVPATNGIPGSHSDWPSRCKKRQGFVSCVFWYTTVMGRLENHVPFYSQKMFDPIIWWIPRSSLHGSSTAFISPFISPTEASIYHQSDSCLQICEVNFSERGLSLSAWRRTRARGFSTLKIFPCQKSMGFWKNVWKRLQVWRYFRYLS